MKTRALFLVSALAFFTINSVAQQGIPEIGGEAPTAHRDPIHNFTMLRLLIINNKNEMLMVREDYVWAPPAILYDKRAYLKERLYDLAADYGLKIGGLKLHGYFSYKYEYHPFATMRSYFMANYVNGDIKIPRGMNEVKWVAIPEAIRMNTVTAIGQIVSQIINFPHTVWGGSFMVSRNDEGHPTKKVEDFYPLFD